MNQPLFSPQDFASHTLAMRMRQAGCVACAAWLIAARIKNGSRPSRTALPNAGRQSVLLLCADLGGLHRRLGFSLGLVDRAVTANDRHRRTGRLLMRDGALLGR